MRKQPKFSIELTDFGLKIEAEYIGLNLIIGVIGESLATLVKSYPEMSNNDQVDVIKAVAKAYLEKIHEPIDKNREFEFTSREDYEKHREEVEERIEESKAMLGGKA